MKKIIRSTNSDFMFKLLKLKLANKKLRHFKKETFIIIVEDSIILGIKRISEISEVERRFITVWDYSFIKINGKEYIYNYWIFNENYDIKEEFLKFI